MAMTLRLPDQLHRRALVQTGRSGVSMNAFVAQALDNYLTYLERYNDDGARQRVETRAHASGQKHGVSKPFQPRLPSKQGVNELCACGSGKKYKKCHGSPVNRPAGPVRLVSTPCKLRRL